MIFINLPSAVIFANIKRLADISLHCVSVGLCWYLCQSVCVCSEHLQRAIRRVSEAAVLFYDSFLRI